MDTIAEWLNPFLSSGSFVAVPLVVLGGLVTAFNPCCLPMYPAVIGYLGQASSQDHVHGKPAALIGITLIFVLGMATATTLMGLLTAMLGWVFGQFSMTVRFALAAVPLIMGLHLLGLIKVPMPSGTPHSPTMKITDGATRKTLLAFGAGFLFTLAIAPCATPILLGVLTLVALQGDLTYGGVLMFIYGLGIGLPFLLIAQGLTQMTHRLASLSFQRWSRRVAGVLMLGVAIYLIWTA